MVPKYQNKHTKSILFIAGYHSNSRVFCSDISSDGSVLCVASQDHVIHLIDSSSGVSGDRWPIYKQVESQFLLNGANVQLNWSCTNCTIQRTATFGYHSTGKVYSLSEYQQKATDHSLHHQTILETC
eukprot:540172_1